MLHYKVTAHDANGKPTAWERIASEQTKGLILTYQDDGLCQWDQVTGVYAAKNGATCFIIGL